MDTGQRLNLETRAIITDMNQPLGRMVGHSVEINESIDTLVGAGPRDLCELTIELAAQLLLMTGDSALHSDAVAKLEGAIQSGNAMEKFAEMVAAQGGDLSRPRPVAPASDVVADRAGWVGSIDNEALGMALIEMGGGRRVKTDTVDHSVGFEMLVRTGDTVQTQQPLVRVFAIKPHAETARHMIASAIKIQDESAPPLELILG